MGQAIQIMARYIRITNEPWQFDGRDENISNRAVNYFNFDDFPTGLDDFELSGVASYLTDSSLSPIQVTIV